MKRVVVRPAAAADIEDAYEWYESQQPGLGDEFLAALRTTRDRLLEHRCWCGRTASSNDQDHTKRCQLEGVPRIYDRSQIVQEFAAATRRTYLAGPLIGEAWGRDGQEA